VDAENLTRRLVGDHLDEPFRLAEARPALPLAVNGNRPTETSRPFSRARASVDPIEAICGRQ